MFILGIVIPVFAALPKMRQWEQDRGELIALQLRSKNIAGSIIGRTCTGREKKISHRCAEFKCVIKSGSDGVRYRTCYVWTASNIDYRIVVQYWLEQSRAAKFSSAKSHDLDTPNNILALVPAQIERVA